MVPMSRVLAASRLLLLCFAPIHSEAYAADSGPLDGTSAYLGNPHWNILVATIVSIENGPFIQLAAASVIFGAPVVCLMLLILSSFVSLTDRARRRAKLAMLLMPLAVTGVYFLYESGISAHTNIRVDLFFIWPALGLTFLIVGISLLLWATASSKPVDPTDEEPTKS
jgi:undecaprenyl pyrophosphate phosphatase UppP